MKILAIDSSGIVASVAVVNKEKTICEFTLNNKLTHGETLVPLIETMLNKANISFKEIDYIATTSGPGSFTGLRIGAGVVKGLAHGLNLKIIPVPTLDSLAYNIFDLNSIIVPIIDAKKNQVYSAFYEYKEGKPIKITDYLVTEIDVIFDLLSNKNKQVIFLGDAANIYKEKILSNSSFIIAPINNNMQRAASIGAFAFDNIDKKINYNDFVPFYLRLSQAEIELERKNTNVSN